MIEKIEVKVLNFVYTVFYNNDIYGSYDNSVIALAICNGLTGLSYTDILEYRVTEDTNGTDYTQKEIFDLQNGVQSNFIIISGVLNQTGTSAPEFSVNSNTNPSLTFNMTYIGVGLYSMVISGGANLSDITEVYMGQLADTEMNTEVVDVDTIQIETRDRLGVLTDNALFKTAILIKIPN